MPLFYKFADTPVGKLKLVASDQGLVAILWENDRPHRVRLSELVENPQHPILVETERQLAEYFAGKRQDFDISLDTQTLATTAPEPANAPLMLAGLAALIAWRRRRA